METSMMILIIVVIIIVGLVIFKYFPIERFTVLDNQGKCFDGNDEFEKGFAAQCKGQSGTHLVFRCNNAGGNSDTWCKSCTDIEVPETIMYKGKARKVLCWVYGLDRVLGQPAGFYIHVLVENDSECKASFDFTTIDEKGCRFFA